MAKQWSDLTCECDGCGASVQVLSATHWLLAEPDMCMPGDMVRCSGCACIGWIAVDEDGAYAAWPDDVCAACHRRLEAVLERVTRKIIAELTAWDEGEL